MSSTNEEMPSSSKHSKQDSSCVESSDQDIYINPVDGLSTEYPTTAEEEADDNSASEDELPTSIMVTNIHHDVFENPEEKKRLEDLFKLFGDNVAFCWLRSFRRVRVTYDNSYSAAAARVGLDNYDFNEKTVLKIFFTQVVPHINNTVTLKLPPRPRQYIISPPASPPAGWEPCLESRPLLDSDLVTMLKSLCPGESYSLCEKREKYPAIVLHIPTTPESEEEKVNVSDPTEEAASTICQERT